MDNDDKIIIQKPEVRLFLQDEVYAFNKEKPETYSLEKEFAMAKKNKKHTNTITLLSLITIMGLLTFGVTKYIEYKNHQITVSVDVFEDLNLKKLLDVVSRLQTQMQQAVSLKNRNETARTTALEVAIATKESELATLDTLKLKASEKRQRINEINQKYNLSVIEINEKYDALLAESEIEIKEIQTQIDAYDSNNVERAKMQQAAIDSQRQLFDIEKKELVEQYEQEMGELRAQLVSLQETEYESRKKIIDEITVQYENQINSLDPVIIDEKGESILTSLEQQKPIAPLSIDKIFNPDLFIEDDTTVNDNSLLENEATVNDSQITESNNSENDSLVIEKTNSTNDELLAQKDTTINNNLTSEAETIANNSVLNDSLVGDNTSSTNGASNSSSTLVGTSITATSDDFYNEIQKAFDDLEYSASVVLSVPYTNSIPSYVVAMRDIARYTGQKIISSTTEYRSQIDELKEKNKTLEQTISQEKKDNEILTQVYSFFEKMALDNGDVGYVLDSSNPKKILIYISPLYESSVNGSSAFIFRKADELIGTVSIIKEGKFAYAIPISNVNNKQILPNDKIVLNFNDK